MFLSTQLLFTDVDECATNNAGCEHDCYNSPGSYSCNCNEGYEVHEDQHQCLRKYFCEMYKNILLFYKSMLIIILLDINKDIIFIHHASQNDDKAMQRRSATLMAGLGYALRLAMYILAWPVRMILY